MPGWLDLLTNRAWLFANPSEIPSRFDWARSNREVISPGFIDEKRNRAALSWPQVGKAER
jgi:hypothetical protein